MFFKNAAGGVIPNFPVQTAIVEMHRQVAELHGELKAAGCNIVQNFGDLLIEVPAGKAKEVDAIMERHCEMFTHVSKTPAKLQIGGTDVAEAEV